MNLTKKLTVIAAMLAAVVTFQTVAQSPMSPYSRYGYGILRDNVTSAQRAMGGVGYAMNSGRQINAMNPASYAMCDSLTFLFDMGLSYTKLWSQEPTTEGTLKESFNGGGIDYITSQFAVSRKIGMSLGLVPVSSVGYSFGSKIDNGTAGRIGTGGLNQLYLGIGYTPFKNFSVGANVGYLFGTVTNNTYVYPYSGQTSLFQTVVEVRDYSLQFGAQYTFYAGRKNRFTLGVSFTPGKDLIGHAWGINYDVDSDTQPDTVGYSTLRNKYTMPATWGFGINYIWNERLMAEFDVTYANWSKAKFSRIDVEGSTRQRFNNRLKYAFGLQYTPHPRGRYLQRVNYRAGVFHEKSYINVLGNDVKEYGVSCGFGLPAPQSKTVLNLGVEWRRRQASPANLIREDYIAITLGINFNERWFYQNKIY
ncbi:MAG: hypothetical protein NC343_05645 [Muribaculum sp.]|nr:hypothetical protein [Muribaculaceae bacterium]MCM1081215.1 hypothetical protein [Muribaculum sp.]